MAWIRVVVVLMALVGATPLAARPANAVLQSNRGITLYEKGDYEGAIAAYNEAIRLDQGFGLAYANRGGVYFKMGEVDRAIADYTKAIGLGFNDPVTVLNRGTAYFTKGDLDSAIADCSTIKRLNPRNAVAHRTCGVAYEKKGDRAAAFANFDEAVRLDPKNYKAFNARGSAYARAGDAARAVADLAQAARLHPDIARDHDYVVAMRDAKAALAAGPGPGVVATAKPSVPTPPIPAVALGAENRVALVIGNSAYTAVSRLDNPPGDAEAVARALREAGFRTVNLRSDLGHDAMRRALNAFSAEAAQADWAVVYYAGHGIEVGGTNYLVPVDAALKSDRAVQFEAVPLDQVLASIEGARKLRLVILDACRDNPFLRDMARTVASRSIGRGLARVEPESGGTLVAYAAKAGQVAWDGAAGQKNSPFVGALVKTMARPGIEIRKLFGVVRDEVLAQTDRNQEPFVYGSLGGDDYYFKAP